uniref:Secreted protein n=1 Tax=Arundo donax TaxID=35708 RepID=A0A0A8XQ30_ARUDO
MCSSCVFFWYISSMVLPPPPAAALWPELDSSGSFMAALAMAARRGAARRSTRRSCACARVSVGWAGLGDWG